MWEKLEITRPREDVKADSPKRKSKALVVNAVRSDFALSLGEDVKLLTIILW